MAEIAPHPLALTHKKLDELAAHALEISLESPRQGWELMAAAEKEAQAQDDDFLAAKAAWYLGRAANEYGRPPLAAEALHRAESLFKRLDQPEWLAATAWQRHFLCWAVPDLTLAIHELKTAADTLQNAPAPLRDYLPHCQLTLAYARLLAGDHDQPSTLLNHCMTAFIAANDLLHQARTLFVHSGLLRRTAPFKEAKAASHEGMALAQSVNAAADIGRFHCQNGFNYWLCDGDNEAAANSFQQGIQQFQALDIPGWVAQCQEGLAQIYLMTGRLSKASQLLQSVLAAFQQDNVSGQIPPTLMTVGWLEMHKGNYELSLDYYNQSKTAYQKVGNQKMIPVVQMHLGDTCIRLGHFQKALRHLEQAYLDFETLNQPNRVAECGLRLAHLWTKLGSANKALAYLDEVKKHALAADHAAAVLSYYFRLAEHLDEQDSAEGTLEALTAALNLAQEQQNPNIQAQCRRQLAKSYARHGALAQAAQQLTLAENSVETMGTDATGLPHERAACLLIWGDIYRQQGHHEKASAAWKEAGRLSQSLMPDLHWQAAAALAQLAEENGRKADALHHYRQMVKSLRLLRQGFWQPELAGGYLKRPSAYLDQGVLLFTKSGRHQEALTFIEETKAQATARRIQAEALFREFNLVSEEAQHIMTEIRSLQERLRTSNARHNFPFRAVANEMNYERLREKIDSYTDLLARSQREQIDLSHLPPTHGFHAEQFAFLASKHIGSSWVALDYYQVGSQLVCLLLTPTEIKACPIALDHELMAVIETLKKLQNPNGKLPLSFLKDAGKMLLPTAVLNHLQERKTLIIAPHRDLHRLPWAALHVNGPTYRPLVDVAAPVIVPSLHTLSLLWQREERKEGYSNGLLSAVSTFQGRHPALPAVHEEIQKLAPFTHKIGRILLDREATAPALLTEMENNRGSQGYDFWHIASHAFHDEHSGRLSGLALYDRDFWLDEIWQLAPLPSLVTFSTCGSSRSRLFEGDEHISLTTTCLTAGANHVVGSIWNVKDAAVPGIMADFYARLLHPEDGTAVPVSEALAQTQRRAWANGESWQQWAGFRCTGRP